MLDTAAIHDSRCRTVLERRVLMFVLKSEWHLMGSPEIPLLNCQDNLALMRPRVSVLGGGQCHEGCGS